MLEINNFKQPQKRAFQTIWFLPQKQKIWMTFEFRQSPARWYASTSESLLEKISLSLFEHSHFTPLRRVPRHTVLIQFRTHDYSKYFSEYFLGKRGTPSFVLFLSDRLSHRISVHCFRWPNDGWRPGIRFPKPVETERAKRCFFYQSYIIEPSSPFFLRSPWVTRQRNWTWYPSGAASKSMPHSHAFFLSRSRTHFGSLFCEPPRACQRKFREKHGWRMDGRRYSVMPPTCVK